MLSIGATTETPLGELIAPVLLVAGVVLLGVLLTLSIRGKIARRNAQHPEPREAIERIKTAGHHRADAEAHASELEQTARRLAAQLDNKAARLELLLAEAEQRVAELRGAIGQASLSPAADEPAPQPEPDRAAAKPGQAPRADLDPLTRAVYQLSDGGRSPVQIAQELDEQIGKVELILALRAC